MQKRNIVSIKDESREKYKDKFTGDFRIKNILDKDDSREKGDVICIPAFMLHWHGSVDNKQDFTHIAIRKRTEIENIWF